VCAGGGARVGVGTTAAGIGKARVEAWEEAEAKGTRAVLAEFPVAILELILGVGV
jgi:hypothetical protein